MIAGADEIYYQFPKFRKETCLMSGLSSFDGMQSRTDPHICPIRIPNAIMVNAMMREMLRSMAWMGGIPSNGIMKTTNVEIRVR